LITERKKQKEELRKYRKNLEQLVKGRTKELENHIITIFNYLEILSIMPFTSLTETLQQLLSAY